jgi:hypothetical protein
VFNNAKNLALLYPERKVFHRSEVFVYYHFSIRYCIEVTHDIERAIVFLKLLQHIDPEDEEVLRLGSEFRSMRCMTNRMEMRMTSMMEAQDTKKSTRRSSSRPVKVRSLP